MFQRIKKRDPRCVCFIDKKILKQDRGNDNISMSWKLTIDVQERGVPWGCIICGKKIGEEGGGGGEGGLRIALLGGHIFGLGEGEFQPRRIP